ncbi:Crp/Fnr family transcriptional regulator [Salicibibacter cibarius]|nr:Crp/Fnr family transcriptional regulator [Salicibibacter cibarius]
MNKLYFVLRGRVLVSKVNEEGKLLVFHYHFKNDLFGEFNPHGEHESAFTARAAVDSVIGVIHQDEFEALLKTNGDAAMAFTQWQSMKRITEYKFRDLMFHGKEGALAATLLRTANTYRKENDQRVIITRTFTDREFAEMLGTSRETVNRLLASFKRKKIITDTEGYIEILDETSLKALCQCEECPVSICRL